VAETRVRAPMRLVTIPAVVCALAILASARVAATQAAPRPGVIDGVVTDSALVPLGDATVSVLGSAIRVVTGANGRFRVRDMNPATYILLVRRIGFEAASLSVQLSPGDTVRPSFALLRATTKLDTVTVKGERLTPALQEFESRRKLGVGHFITQAEIDRQNPLLLSDLLVMVPSVRVGSNGGWPVNIRSGCGFAVYLDGVRLPTGSGFNDIAPPKEIAGIEIYSGAATIPVQYKPISGSFCGVILLWTRIGS
jgi:Carboxypeptidase regulatory-like domain/TonB-dependent Receptor Plug Domain